MSAIKRNNFSNIPAKPANLYITEPCKTCVPSRCEEDWNKENEATPLGSLVGFNNHYKRETAATIQGLCKYQSVQYHPGQLERLKKSIESRPHVPTLLLVNASLAHDLYFLDDLMLSNNLKKSFPYMKHHRSNKNLNYSLQQYKSVSVPIKIFNCCVEDEFYYDRKEDECWELNEIPTLLRYVTHNMDNDNTYDVRIVQVSINKDHDCSSLWGIGTICLHLIQPFYFREFHLKNANLPPHLALVHHFATDTSACSPVLAPSIMAFILCYMDHVGSITFEELDSLFLWFMRSAIANNVHLAFTGKMEYIREYCFLVLGDLIRVDDERCLVLPIKYDKLKDQAEIVVPKMARMGLIAYAMLKANNSNSAIQQRKLKPGMKISKKKVLQQARKILEFLENRMLFRKPCEQIDDYIYSSFNTLGELYGYFSLTDPAALRKDRNDFLGCQDYDSDYPSDVDDNPMYDPWISLSPRGYRCDRLNLCLNAIHEYARESAAKTTTRRHGDLPSAPSPSEMNSRFLN